MASKARTPAKASPRSRKSADARAREREQFRAGQRIRLAVAMIDAIAESGYRATRVADVIARAGVSRKTFYEHFANKQECLLVTFDLVADEGLRRIEVAFRAAKDWPGPVEAAIRAVFESAIENPGALRLSLLEIAAVGPAGIERRERAIERYEGVIREALELAPGEGTVSETTLKAVVGGLNRVLYRRVLRGEDAELLALVPDLTTWATSYYPTPPAMLAEPTAMSAGERSASVLEGGRAPGTLAPHPVLGGRRGLPRGDQNVSRSFVEHSQRARILDAVANLTAGEGYASLKVEDIAEQAAVSLNAFYEHYGSKEDAFLVAYEIGHGKGLSLVERAYASESDWRLSVRAGDRRAVRVSRDGAVVRPHRAAGRADRDAAHRRALEPRHEGVRADARARPGRGARREPRAAVTIEAIAGGIFDLCLHYALQGTIRELPELTASATYIALAPFIGGEQAAQIALGPPAAPSARKKRARAKPGRWRLGSSARRARPGRPSGAAWRSAGRAGRPRGARPRAGRAPRP